MFVRTNGRMGRFVVRGLLFAVALACACPGWAQFQIANPPDGAAIILKLDGQVSVLTDNVPWALTVGGWVKPGQEIITGPSSGATFRLADGSTFEVFADSRVSFRASQGNWRDLLDVWLGNIRVHIQKLGGQPNHNRVHTPTALISVRGTTFEVNVEDNGDTTYVMVEEGLVDVENLSAPSGKIVQLAPGDAVRVYKNVPLARNVVDKGAIARQVGRGLAQAAYEVLLGRQRAPGSSTSPTSTGGSGGGVGDTKPSNPPPPPPPPPPSAP